MHSNVYVLNACERFERKTLLYELSFVELVFTGLKSNRTNKTNNKNPFECILTTDKIRSNGN